MTPSRPGMVVLGLLLLAGCTASPAAGPRASVPTTSVESPSSSVPPTTKVTPATPSTTVPGPLGPVIVEPDAGMAGVYAFMGAANSSLTMTMYELVDQTAEQILVADAARGVRVRVLLDARLEAGRNQPARAYLAAHGVAVVLAPASRITHQKTICTDDTACLVLSLNMVEADYADTRDVAIEDRDSVDVSAIESTFAADFGGTTAPASSDADHLLWSPGSEPGLVGVIDGAQHLLWVENEEMASTAVTDALMAAARRGVDVDVCMTADSSYTDALVQIVAAGGHVHLYPDRRGLLYIHEKLVLADDGSPAGRAVVGSINFSTSSMTYNRELDLVLDEQNAPEALAALGGAFQKDFAGAPAL